MLLSGFTFVRNAVKYDYPVRESILSMLPLVDELVVNLGNSEDETEHWIRSIRGPGSEKIRVIHSVWDESKKKDGLILSEQTNIALEHCHGRWCLYLQADEAIHEKDHARIRHAVQTEDQRPEGDQVDGFLFPYLHFYSGYRTVQQPIHWYPHEIRVVRKNSGAKSYGDAQTFRHPDRVLSTKPLDAFVYHYGHAREPEKMVAKINYFHRFWHGDNHKLAVATPYKETLKNLVWFWGTHPAPFRQRAIEAKLWQISPENLPVHRKLERLIILADGKNWDLATRLKEKMLAEDQFKGDVQVCESLMEWFKAWVRSAGSRRKSALVDLRAEDRNNLGFLCWCLDGLLSFNWRIAFAPSGKLSRFRRWFYTSIVWGRHEDRRPPQFVVPPELYERQISCWLGFDRFSQNE